MCRRVNDPYHKAAYCKLNSIKQKKFIYGGYFYLFEILLLLDGLLIKNFVAGNLQVNLINAENYFYKQSLNDSMKKRNIYLCMLTLLAGFFLLIFQTGCSSGNKLSADSKVITQAINDDQWIFTANMVMPQSGRSRIVNGQYDVEFKKDTLNVYLPYFGRSFSTSGILNNQSPLDFKSTEFSYIKELGKKGAWLVIVKPKDNSEVQSLSFTLSADGYANLDVLLTNRSPISFRGTISPIK